MKRKVAVFDFDGTITLTDTFVSFIKYVFGSFSCYLGFLYCSPFILLMKLNLIPNEYCKIKVFSYFFRGMDYKQFKDYCFQFQYVIKKEENDNIIKALQEQINNGSDVYVVSASIEDWIEPYCMQFHIKKVIGTRVEVNSSGRLTGRFIGHNCNGREKVSRFLEVEPDRNNYYLFVYGDSVGDRYMLDLADEGTLVKNRK